MSMNRPQRGAPRVPTLPTGEQVASYGTYLDAQRAVDHLADQAFPVEKVTIVGTDLRMVERVTGRLTYSRVALAGALSGAWFGLFVGLVLWIFSDGDAEALPIVPAMAIGAAFGILFSVISYSLTGGKRDFTSTSQIVAGSYAILCAAENAGQARGLLLQLGGMLTPPPRAPEPDAPTLPRQPGAPEDPTQPPPSAG